MIRKPSRVGAEFADEYLGHEKNIVMNVEDARYRYYQWLRGWYGMGKKEDTNKCPFYQFMFWGSLLMLASIVPIIIMKIIDIFVLWPLSWIAPDFVDDFNKSASKSKMVFSWAITCTLMVIAMVVGLFLAFNILAWVGLVVHWLFAIPYILLVLTWLGVVFLVTEVIPWLFYGIGFVFEAILTAIIALINIPWLSVILWIMVALGAIAGITITLVLLYKLAVWFFKSSFTAWVIRKSCDIREFRIRKHKEHKVKVHKKKKQRLELKEEEIWKEPNEKWNEILMAAFEVIWVGLKIFPGYPFKLIGYFFRWVFKGIVLMALGLRWICEKIFDVIIVVWSLISETISNHCPPIDFVVEINETGELVIRPSGGFRFTSENLDGDILFAASEVPDSFKPSKAKDGRQATIRCMIKTSDLEYSKRSKDVYEGRSNMEVFKILDLKYVPYRTTRKK